MVLGFDEQRPTKADYKRFLRTFAKGLEGIGIDRISLMIYGSYAMGRAVIGRSDIDALLILPGDVVISSEAMEQASRALHEASRENNTPFQVTVSDLETMADGRFNTYDPTFEDYFRKNGRVVIGQDYRSAFRFERPESVAQEKLTHKLRGMRGRRLNRVIERGTGYVPYLESFEATLETASNISRYTMQIVMGEVQVTRFEELPILLQTFPEVNVDPLLRIRRLFRDTAQLDAIYKDEEAVNSLWDSSVSFAEQLVRAYIRKYPRVEEAKPADKTSLVYAQA